MGLALLDALAGATCAPLLRVIGICWSDFDSHTAAAFGMHLGQDAFPNLEVLALGYNPRIGSDGVLALLAGIKNAKQMCLTRLVLSDVGMDDDGMAELVLVAHAGKFQRLSSLNVSENVAVTNEGVVAFARALQAATPARGVDGFQVGGCIFPKLESIDMNGLTLLSTRGFGALALAAFMCCPQLLYLELKRNCNGDDDMEDKAIYASGDDESSA